MNNARLYQVLRGPVFSEKSQMLGDSLGVQVFKIDSNATKLEVEPQPYMTQKKIGITGTNRYPHLRKKNEKKQ